MYWSRFCYYALICFLTPLESPKEGPNSTNGVCQLYTSEDVVRKSVIMNLTPDTEASVDGHKECFDSGPIHTLLVHNEGDGTRTFFFPGDIMDFEHIILIKNTYPSIEISHHPSRKRKKAVSLTVVETDIDFDWPWLGYLEFKHIHFEDVSVAMTSLPLIRPYLISQGLHTATFKNGRDGDPWHRFWLQEAKNLRVLRINGYNIPNMKSITGPDYFQSLRILDLANNRIQTFEPNFFSQKPALKEVDLSNNLLKDFRGTFEPGLVGINFFGNPFMEDREKCIYLEDAEDPDIGKRIAYCPAR